MTAPGGARPFGIAADGTVLRQGDDPSAAVVSLDGSMPPSAWGRIPRPRRRHPVLRLLLGLLVAGIFGSACIGLGAALGMDGIRRIAAASLEYTGIASPVPASAATDATATANIHKLTVNGRVQPARATKVVVEIRRVKDGKKVKYKTFTVRSPRNGHWTTTVTVDPGIYYVRWVVKGSAKYHSSASDWTKVTFK